MLLLLVLGTLVMLHSVNVWMAVRSDRRRRAERATLMALISRQETAVQDVTDHLRRQGLMR